MEINIVTGGTGFVGKNLVKKLLESGKNVLVIIRPLDGVSGKERSIKMFSEYFAGFPDKFSVLEGDITIENLGINPDYLQELSKKNIIFWHLAANLSFSSKDKDKVICTNHIGTINTLNLANRIANKFIYVSTAYVCGNTTTIFYEDDLTVGQKFRNNYESSKFEAEKHIRNNCKVSYSIFRPSIIMGDAYEGKAEGCTFGYYRFAYMFFIFKNWIVKKLQTGSFLTRKILILMGTKYDKHNDILVVPWLILPYTPAGTVDMVSVDYVIDSLINGASKTSCNKKTIHLINPNPPTFKFAMTSLVDDLRYQKVKFLKVPAFLLTISIKLLYRIFPPLRVKTRSAMWYLPYITRKYYFSQENNKIIGLPIQEPITREFLRKINTYAQGEIFNKINMD